MEYIRHHSDLYKYRYLYLLEASLSMLFTGMIEYCKWSRFLHLAVPMYYYSKKYYYLHESDTFNPSKDIPEDFEYPQGWYKVADSNELTPGKIQSLQFCGKDIVIFRTRDNKVSVTDAYCPHLGAHLGKGTIKNNCIECPFHGWQFCDGQCSSIPYSKSVPKYQLKMWTSQELNKGIYVWYPQEDHPKFELKALPPDQIKYYHGKTEHFVSCRLQDIPENGSDIHHFNILHKEFVHSWIRPITHAYEGQWNISPEEKYIAHLQVKNWLEWCGVKIVPTTSIVNISQIGPGIVHLDYHLPAINRNILIIQTVTPLGPNCNKFHHMAYSNSYLLHFLSKLILKATADQVNRDVMIWNQKKFMSQPRLIREDKSIREYRRWFSQFYTKNIKIGID